ncbi:CHAT domain-containing protein [Irpex rosettiformis]|uniref:CHAT domain-containing protein n=2 Tax=Irpex rosettiformis TaxID=378272 RepID=A0ACB8TV49_9APHY|nr:CHAT domain-containing protein [Irpex rosettiformis]
MRIVGGSAYQQYQTEGDLEALDFAIESYRVAMDAIEDDHPEKASVISNLGGALYARYKVGEAKDSDLEEAISLVELADALTPDDSPDKPSLRSNLAASVLSRFELGGREEDLEEAIAIWTHTLQLVPGSHPSKPTLLQNLGSSLTKRFTRLGNLEDLERAIGLDTHAIELTPDGHPHKSVRLRNAGNSLCMRFKQLGELDDLERGIEMHNRAVKLTPDGHPHKVVMLADTGNALQTRFERLGDLEDLERAIVLHTRAVDLAPDSHQDKPLMLNGAGNSLQMRFKRLGNLDDLERSIGFYDRAIKLMPDSHWHKPSILYNAGNALEIRFELLGKMEDLERAIEFHTRAVELTPDGHPAKPWALANAGNSVGMRFEGLGNLDDLDQAITYITNAISLPPEDHPHKPSWLCNLGRSLEERFNHVGDVSDLDEAIRCGLRSVELLPDNHPERARNLQLLGLSLTTRLRSPHAHTDDATRAMESYVEAIEHTASHPLERLLSSAHYARLLAEFPDLFPTPLKFTLLEAYKLALNLIPRCIWLGNNVRGRYTSKELQVVGEVVNDAVSAAITAGEYGLALEWLEAGRAVVLSQVLQLRTPLDDLQRHHPQLARDLHHVSQALKHAASPASSSLSGSTPTDAYHTLDSQAQSSHGYALQYEKLIAQVRELKGFENFMRPKKLVELNNACASGPVVVVNVHETSCDALILCRAGDVVHVPLPDFSLVDAMETQRLLWDTLRAKRLLNRCRGDMRDDDDDRGGRVTAMDPPDLMRIILADLWTPVVKPIMDVVRTLVPPSTTLPHVTWCPTGPLTFLPLHAAGIYPGDKKSRGPPQCVTDIAVSSYTPTLEALLKPRTRVAPTLQDPRVLIVSQPDTPGCSSIPGTTTEAATVMSLVGQSKVLNDDDGTIQAVLEGMATHEWVHLACHGVQNTVDPTNSAFALYDGQLTLGALMSQHLPNADLAVLSACQTATGDEKLSEEAVHLAAGMLNIGYKSVIGTMWSISDYIAPEVMRVFYTVMAEQVKTGGELQPAYALHEATKMLREKKGGMDDSLRWVPFVHFGL